MYRIFTYIYNKNQLNDLNVGQYALHWSCGIGLCRHKFTWTNDKGSYLVGYFSFVLSVKLIASVFQVCKPIGFMRLVVFPYIQIYIYMYIHTWVWGIVFAYLYIWLIFVWYFMYCMRNIMELSMGPWDWSWPFRSQQGLVKKPGSGTIDILRVTWGWMDLGPLDASMVAGPQVVWEKLPKNPWGSICMAY